MAGLVEVGIGWCDLCQTVVDLSDLVLPDTCDVCADAVADAHARLADAGVQAQIIATPYLRTASVKNVPRDNRA